MASKNQELVSNFYSSEFFKDSSVLKDFLHPEVELSWYGTTGLRVLDYDGIASNSMELGRSFESLRADIEKVITKGDDIAVNLTYFVRTIENPDEEMPLGHFIAMWEVKEGLLFRGVQISQLGEEVDQSPWK